MIRRAQFRTSFQSIPQAALVTAVVLLALCSGCTGSTRRTLTVYSPHGKEMLGEFERRFESAHPEIDVQWLDMGSQDAYDRIRTERANPQADIWWGAPSSIFEKAAAEGLLEPYVPTWDSAVAPAFKSRDGSWYGTFITPEVIMFNSHALTESDAPSDWDGLLDPKWRGKIIIRYPLASGTMRIIFGALIQRENVRAGDTDAGFKWLRKLDANTKTYAADPTQLYLKIAREEGLLTLWNLPDVILQTNANGYPFGYVLPASGTPLITDCIAVVKGAKNATDARMFYEFVTSVASLEIQARDYYRIPAREDFPPDLRPEWLRAIQLKAMDVDWGGLEQHEKAWMKFWDENIKGRGLGSVQADLTR